MTRRRLFPLLTALGVGVTAGGVHAQPAMAPLVPLDSGAGIVLWVLLGLLAVAAWGGMRWQRRRLEETRRALEREVELHVREAETQKKMLRHLNATLRASNERLQELSEQKSRLLSIAAHDLKTPLSSIYSLADILLEEREQGPPNYEFVELIQQTARDMSALIENVLTSAASEMGQVGLHCVATDLAELAERALGQCSGTAERKGQQVAFRTRGESFPVLGDELRLVEVMTNLISNAVKYSPLEGQIAVEVERSPEWVCFSVVDDGPGLSEADREKLFQPFQRLSAQPTGGESSSGLGLYIVRQYVELHGGVVGAASTPGEGSTFWFCLPVLSEGVTPAAIPAGAVPESRA